MSLEQAEREAYEAVEAARRALEAEVVASPGQPTPGFIATAGGGSEYAPCPTGAHIARCFAVIALGVQESTYGTSRKLLLMWEVLDAKRDDGEPHILSRQFTMSTHKKAALRNVIDSWRGKPLTDEQAKAYDVSKLLGQHAQLQVQHRDSPTGKTYANIAGVFPPPVHEIPKHTREDILFDAERPDPATYAKLPEWVQRICDERVQ